MLGYVSQGGVGDEGNFLDVPVVIAHETEVVRQCAEGLPSRKGRGIDDDAGKPASPPNKWIDCFREVGKVALFERSFRSHD